MDAHARLVRSRVTGPRAEAEAAKVEINLQPCQRLGEKVVRLRSSGRCHVRMVVAFGVAIGLSLSSSVLAQTGSISGRVTFEGNPMPGVTVTLQSQMGGGPRGIAPPRTTTDADGRFRLGGVAAGRYFVSSIAPGYVTQRDLPYGSPGKSVTLAEGETVEGIDFTLLRGGVITGRVTEAGGRPVIEEHVNLMRIDEGGQKHPYNEYITTDDRGIYRVYGLMPGRYLVSVGIDKDERMSGMGFQPRRLRLTFHPNALEEARATVVEVTGGGEATGVDIDVREKTEMFEASGRAVDAETGQPVPLIRMGVGTPRPDTPALGSFSYGLTTDGRGEFRLTGLSSGRYAVFAAPDSESDLYSEPVSFEVREGDVSGLEVKVRRGGSISGVAVVEGSSDLAVLAQVSQLRLHAFSRSTELSAPRVVPNRINPDGSFLIRGVSPGKIMFSVSGVRFPSSFTLVRLEHQGVEQRDGIELGPGEKVSGVRLVIGYGTGVIRGEVKIIGGKLPDNVLLRVMARNTTGTPRGIRPGEVDARGRFVIEGLLAGDYELTLTPAVYGSPGGTPQPRLPQVKQTVTVTTGAEAQVTLNLDLGQKNEQ